MVHLLMLLPRSLSLRRRTLPRGMFRYAIDKNPGPAKSLTSSIGRQVGSHPEGR